MSYSKFPLTVYFPWVVYVSMLLSPCIPPSPFSCPTLADCSYVWDGDVLRIEAKTVGPPDRDELERLAGTVWPEGEIRIEAAEAAEGDFPCRGGKRSIRNAAHAPDSTTV